MLHIHHRLADIFGSSLIQMFSELSFIAVGDLYQLAPVIQSPVFSEFENDLLNLNHPWENFKIGELKEVVRE